MSTFLQEHDFPSGSLPELPKIPVLRSAYCSQELTDKVLQYLWDNAPDLVREQAKREHLNYDQEYGMQLGHIVTFIQKVASKDVEIPKTRLGMLDLLFEMSRRFRKLRNLPDAPVRGIPLAEGPDAPMPALPTPPISFETQKFLSQETADNIIKQVYSEHPAWFYELTENMRRGGMYIWPVGQDIREALRQFVLPNGTHLGASKTGTLVRDIDALYGEIIQRLLKVCKIQR